MGSMFHDASSFNGDVSKWDVSEVKVTDDMFNNASSFNGDVSKWDVSKVFDMSFMFAQANKFSGDLTGWDVSDGTDIANMFKWDGCAVCFRFRMPHSLKARCLEDCGNDSDKLPVIQI